MSAIIKKSIRHESNVNVNYIRLFQGDIGIDITPIFVTLVVEEDIEYGFIHGSIIILDNILNSRDVLNGTEYLDISFASMDGEFKPFEPYEKRFRVTKYENITQAQTGQFKALKMNFATDAVVINDSIKLKRMYTNTSSSDFIKKISTLLKLDSKKLFVEETLHAKNFLAPNVSPLDMVNWIKLTSQSKETNGSDFYFFENKTGVHFKSMDSIKSMEPVHTIIFKPNYDNYTYNCALKFERPKGYDIQDDIRHGGAGATLYTHDMITKDYKKFVYDTKKIPSLNPVNPRGKDYESSNDSYVQFWSHNNSYSTLDLNSNTHSALLRSMTKTLINYKTTNIEIPGNVDIKSGDIINVKTPGLNGEENVMESGKWLVKKLKHIITQDNFHTQLEISSDGNIESVHE